MFDEEYLITVPLNERQTTYLAGMYYSLDDAITYQKAASSIALVVDIGSTSFVNLVKEIEAGNKITRSTLSNLIWEYEKKEEK